MVAQLYSTLALAGMGLYLLYLVYNVYWHPLAALPGPLWWRASRLGFVRSFLAGRLVRDVRQLHDRYGDVVRIAPDEVSFARDDVWADALGGRAPLPRNATFFKTPPGRPDNLVMTADPAASARMRSVIAPAFTERALAEQESRVQFYADLLIRQLRSREELSGSGLEEEGIVIDLVDWLNWFAFDLVGELAFGEGFKCLEETKHHPWISMIFSSIKMSAFAAVTRYFAGLEPLLMQLVPPSIRKMEDSHFGFATDMVHRRMRSSKQNDFMTPMLDGNPGFKRMSLPEIESTMAVLTLAGSETTATTLCGIGNCLVQNPEQLRQLEAEVRSTFDAEDQMTLRALQKLPYLNAVISEGLRVCNPVAGGILRSVPKGGSVICGHYLPEGTHVLVNSAAMSLSESNFHRADKFLPERFLPEELRPAEFQGDQRNNQKPFGLGLRSCLGKSFALAEMRLVLARLVWRFDLSGAPGKTLDWNSLKSYVVVQKEPVRIVVKDRVRPRI